MKKHRKSRSLGAKLHAATDRFNTLTHHFSRVKQQFYPLVKMCREGPVSYPNLPTLVRKKICHVLRSDGWILQKVTSYWTDMSPSGGTYKHWKRLKKEINPVEYVEKFRSKRSALGWVEDTKGL